MVNGTKVSITTFWNDYEGVLRTRIFHLKVYRVTTDELFLGRKFYEDNGRLPGAIHHEIEILGISSPNIPRPEIFHRHKGYNGKYFICFCYPIPSFEKLIEVLKTWCLGTTLSMIWGIDFQEIMGEGVNPKQLEELLKIEYGLTI
jgi:hypothetical protein